MTSIARLRERAIEPTAWLDARFTDVAHLQSAAGCLVYAGAYRYGPHRDRPVVIKIPHSPDAVWAIEAVVRDGDALRAIGPHPHVVELLDRLQTTDGRPALVLARYRGAMSDRTDHLPTIRSALAVGVKLANALDAAHVAGVLHTDVRPATVFLTDAGEPALGGFGAATPVDPLRRSAHTVLHSTTAHTAPELIEGRPACAATDVYGLAVTLFELIAGHPAYPRYRAEPESGASLRILRGTRAHLPPDVPIEVADLLDWALAVDPGERPPSPAWLAEELRRVSAHVAPRPRPWR